MNTRRAGTSRTSRGRIPSNGKDDEASRPTYGGLQKRTKRNRSSAAKKAKKSKDKDPETGNGIFHLIAEVANRLPIISGVVDDLDESNASPQEAASNTETCENRCTVKRILPMSKKTGATKKRSRDTADEMDMRFLEELKQLREQASSQNVDDSDRQFLLSLLPMMKQLSPIDNMDIKIEIYETFYRKMFKSDSCVQNACYWTDQNQSRTPSPCASYVSDCHSEYSNVS